MISVPEGVAVGEWKAGRRRTNEHQLPGFKSRVRKRIFPNVKNERTTPLQRTPLLRCWCCCTDLSVEVHICHAIEGKLVAVGPILVDVGHSQPRQLPHRFIVTGHRSEFNGGQRKLLAAPADAVTGQQEQRQQQRANSGHGGRVFRQQQGRKVKFVLLCLRSVTFGIKTNVDRMTGTKFAGRQRALLQYLRVHVLLIGSTWELFND